MNAPLSNHPMEFEPDLDAHHEVIRK